MAIARGIETHTDTYGRTHRTYIRQSLSTCPTAFPPLQPATRNDDLPAASPRNREWGRGRVGEGLHSHSHAAPHAQS